MLMSIASGRKAQWMPALWSSFLLQLFYHVSLCGADVQDWSYNESSGNGPSNWARAHPSCGGQFQSPVDLNESWVESPGLKKMVFKNYHKSFHNAVMVNNGHSAEISDDGFEASLTGGCLGEAKYEFKQVHFHWGSNDSLGSEHLLAGRPYSMEGHIVHFNRKYGNMEEAVKHPDGIAVLAVFYQISDSAAGSMEPVIEAVKEVSQREINEPVNVGQGLTLSGLLPDQKDSFFCYEKGSLTTPECQESVTWTIMKVPLGISGEQMAEFRNLRFEDGTSMVNNFRPVQPLNGRTVYFHSNR